MTSEYYCTRCGERLNENRAIWLELDTNTGLYHREGQIPTGGLSQGFFIFGAACAKRELAETTAALDTPATPR